MSAEKQAQSNYELYRRSSLGIALTDTLDELIQDGHIEPQTALRFDTSFAEALSKQVRSKASMKGHLHTYRFCDDVWTFIVDENPNFRFDNENVQANRVKIVACSAKVPSGGN
eukprot:jgi/Hompol1/2791/HPOL_000383-RA